MARFDPRTGNVALIIDPDLFGRSGFVRATNPSQSDGPMYNLNFDEPVAGRCRFQAED